MRTIVVYDSLHSGHHIEYLSHIARHHHNHSDVNVLFLVHPICGKALSKIQNGFEISMIEEDQLGKFEQFGNLIQRADAEVKFVMEFAKKISASHVLFMDLDRYQLSLRKSSITPIPFSGILMRPYSRLQGFGWKNRFKKYLAKRRKALQLTLLLRNKNLKSLFVLNDKESVSQLNANHKSSVFKYIVEPVHLKSLTPKETENLDLSEIKLLIFGTIDERKNIPNIIRAIHHLDLDSKISLSINGRSNSSVYTQKIKSLIEQFASERFTIEFNSEFISNDKISDLFNACDIILLAYKDFNFSSNILGYSALFQKPLLATKFGVIGDIVRNYAMGTTVDPYSFTDIAKGLKALIDSPIKVNGKPYLSERKNEYFVAQLLRS